MLQITYQSGLTVETITFPFACRSVVMPSTTDCSIPLPPPGTTAMRTGGAASAGNTNPPIATNNAAAADTKLFFQVLKVGTSPQRNGINCPTPQCDAWGD